MTTPAFPTVFADLPTGRNPMSTFDDAFADVLSGAYQQSLPASVISGILATANGGEANVSSRTAMAALDTTKNTVAWLTESGRQGWFQWNSTDLSAQVTLDPLQGVYVAPASATTGASGAWVRVLGLQQPPNVLWFGAKGDGVTNDLAAIQAAVTFAGNGGAVIITGICRIASTLTITTRVSLFCPTAEDAILVDVGAGNNGVVYSGGASGINGLNIQLNVYGRASACLNAVYLTRVDRSRIFLDVYAGAAQYGVVIDGCLINQIHIESTTNKTPPITSPAFQVDHLLMQENGTYSVSCNVNNIWVNLEGARHGITQSAMPGGGNYISGCIEGLSGRGLTMGHSFGLHLFDLWLEANGAASTFDSTEQLYIGPTFEDIDSTGVTLTSCKGTLIDGFSGKLTIDSTCIGSKLGQVQITARGNLTVNDTSAVIDAPIVITSSSTVFPTGPGDAVMENIFLNPFIDIWTAGAAAAPDGGTLTNATITRATATPFPGNPSKVYGVVAVTGTTIADGLNLTADESPATDSDWVSIMVPIRIPTGQQNVRVYLFNGSVYNWIDDVTVRDTWTAVRGSAKTISGNAWYVALRVYDGSSFVAGTFWVGGCTIVKGSHPPRHLSDNGQRLQHVATSVANTPAFKGQRAYVSGTGKWYLAAGATSSADWIILN